MNAMLMAAYNAAMGAQGSDKKAVKTPHTFVSRLDMCLAQLTQLQHLGWYIVSLVSPKTHMAWRSDIYHLISQQHIRNKHAKLNLDPCHTKTYFKNFSLPRAEQPNTLGVPTYI